MQPKFREESTNQELGILVPGPEGFSVIFQTQESGLVRLQNQAEAIRMLQECKTEGLCMAPSFLSRAQIYMALAAPEVPSMSVAETPERLGLASHLRGS